MSRDFVLAEPLVLRQLQRPALVVRQLRQGCAYVLGTLRDGEFFQRSTRRVLGRDGVTPASKQASSSLMSTQPVDRP